MKYAFYSILMVIAILACREKHVVEPKTKELISFDWIVGNWKRVNDAQGQETFEIWHKASPSTYIGKGFTLEKGDTVFLENVALQSNDNGEWSLNVMMKGESQSTIFKVEETKPTSFYCTNGQNSFPKRIDYEILGDTLVATISGGAPAVIFKFGKLSE